jgi:hypothetical protein
MNQLAQLSTQNDNPENLHAKMHTLWNQLQHIKSQRNMDQRSKAEVWRTVREEDTEKLTKVSFFFFLSVNSMSTKNIYISK